MLSFSMLKKLAIITSILVLLFGGAIFYASTLVSDSQLKEIILSGASEAFPKAQIEIPKLEISWGPTLKIVLEGVSLAAKDAPRKKLIKLAKLDLLLPLYSIVTGGGKLELTIDGLAVEDLDERQWDILGGKKTESKTSAASDKPLDVEKPYLTDNFMSTYDKNFGERERPKKKLGGGYFVKVKT